MNWETAVAQSLGDPGQSPGVRELWLLLLRPLPGPEHHPGLRPASVQYGSRTGSWIHHKVYNPERSKRFWNASILLNIHPPFSPLLEISGWNWYRNMLLDPVKGWEKECEFGILYYIRSFFSKICVNPKIGSGFANSPFSKLTWENPQEGRR